MEAADSDNFLRVLIADDSASLRDRLSLMVSQIGNTNVVNLAADVTAAVAALNQSLDLLILDIQMPGGSGLDVLREFKLHSPATIVIMLTNYPYAQYRKKCLALGADYFISKSTNSKDLLRLIERLAKTKLGQTSRPGISDPQTLAM
jgi:DNA-binding NarL/FixJ family response regulator